jgi:hypothetical protein
MQLLFVQLQSLQKLLYGDLKWKKMGILWAFLRKATVLNRRYTDIIV